MKKVLLIFLALLPIGWLISEMVALAVKPIVDLPPHLQEAFQGSGFSPLPEPGPSDWLMSHKEPGQSYREFLTERPLKPGAKGRKFIYLQPLGEFPKEAPQMEMLREYLIAYFYPMEVILSKPLVVDEQKIGARVISSGEKQWNGTDLLDDLQERIPRDAYVVMAVTMTDLYPGDQWSFVFGLARIKQRVGVFSFARYGVGGDPKRALERAFKVISHETGHAFGIRHCIRFHCLMNGSNNLEETDRAPFHVCPVCLRKLHWGLEFDPSERYRQLEKVLRAHEMTGPADWLNKRAVRTTAFE